MLMWKLFMFCVCDCKWTSRSTEKPESLMKSSRGSHCRLQTQTDTLKLNKHRQSTQTSTGEFALNMLWSEGGLTGRAHTCYENTQQICGLLTYMAVLALIPAAGSGGVLLLAVISVCVCVCVLYTGEDTLLCSNVKAMSHGCVPLPKKTATS